MSKEIETRVSELLSAAGVAYSVHALGETKREDWVCDEWRCTFSRPKAIVSSFAPRAGGTADVSETVEYFTGTGHRAVPMVNGRPKRPMSWDNVQSPRELARWKKENEKPVAPHAAGVLHSLILDSSAASQSFADWCSDFGYDTDSRKALATYEACQQCADKLRRIFTHAEIAALSEALQDY